MTSSRVEINVCGTIFETARTTLAKYPNTLLGNDDKRSQYYCTRSKQYFFHRDQNAFENILYFYQSSGTLNRPSNIELQRFIDECQFFELPEWAINTLKAKEGGVLRQRLYDLYHPVEFIPTTFQLKVWKFLEKPDSSKYSRWYSIMYVLTLAMSIAVFCLLNTKEFRIYFGEKVYYRSILVDKTLNCFFLVGWLIRLLVAPSKLTFFKTGLNWIELLALLPFITNSQVQSFKPFQIFRIFRLYWLTKMYINLKTIVIVVRSSVNDVKLFLLALFLIVVFAGAVAYNVEYSEPNSLFVSIPDSIYWAIVTALTIGYGDIVPQTLLGKIFSSLFIALSVPILALPVISVFIRFGQLKDFFQEMKKE